MACSISLSGINFFHFPLTYFLVLLPCWHQILEMHVSVLSMLKISVQENYFNIFNSNLYFSNYQVDVKLKIENLYIIVYVKIKWK